MKELGVFAIKSIFGISAGLILGGCGKGVSLSPLPPTSPLSSATGPGALATNNESIIVKSRATFDVDTTSGKVTNLAHTKDSSLAANQPISIIDSISTLMTLDNSLFSYPPISSKVLSFGYLQLTALTDNNLRVCGTNGTTQCGTAVIRMYTTGTPGPGLYNASEAYGAPISAGQSTLAVVGLNPTGATIMQTYKIPSSQNVMNLSNFTNPKYQIQIDFSNAGVGSYSTTLVVEYGLTL